MFPLTYFYTILWLFLDGVKVLFFVVTYFDFVFLIACVESFALRARMHGYMRCLAFLKMVRPFLYARAASPVELVRIHRHTRAYVAPPHTELF